MKPLGALNYLQQKYMYVACGLFKNAHYIRSFFFGGFKKMEP